MSRKRRAARGPDPASRPDPSAPRQRSRWIWVGGVTVGVALLAGAWMAAFGLPGRGAKATARAARAAGEPTYVGRAACAGCHAEQDRLWRGSDHDLAM